MATRTGGARRQHIGTSMLEQIAGLDERALSPEVARTILEVQFDPAHQARVRELSAKARAGTLSPDEHEELDESIRIGDLLAILQSKARRTLKRTGPRA